MKKVLLSLFVLFHLFTDAQQTSVFPQPNKVLAGEGSFTLNGCIRYNKTRETEAVIPVVRAQFERFHDLRFVETPKDSSQDLHFNYQPDLPEEHYGLFIDKNGIQIIYGKASGLLYALQTLDQWMGDQLGNVTIKSTRIEDKPAFVYRGVHLDCSRHFYTINEIKAFLDQLVMLKYNTFHWHLTDDQGWRLEIKQYPELIRIGAWRDSTIIGHYSRTPREYERKHYGGFYTQEEAREIVRYATARGITVIPEIEMPGHARAALAAYPEYSCTGEQLPVPGLWGVFDDVYCPKPETMEFLKNILTEVMAVFPSETIHIGGDECPKVRWESCPSCRKVMEENDLHDTHELQSYVIREIETFLRANGRKLMGWDEILEGGLADNAQVMSWRGTEGGIAAAKQGHPVVMTPTSFCYFDYYQSGHPDEPLAIGGFLPLEKVYRFDPVPDELTGDERSFILGGQANLWTEYLPTIKDVQYNAFPRLVAMAQVLWTTEKPSYADFVNQLARYYLPRLKQDGINFSTAFLDPKLEPSISANGLVYTITAPLAAETFTVNGKSGKEIVLERSFRAETTTHTVTALLNGQSLRTSEYTFVTHPLIGKPVIFTTPPDAKFDHHNNLGLTDGIQGKRPWKGDQWLGFTNDTVQFAIDLGKKTSFSSIELGCLHDPGSWIYQPKTILIEWSANGKKYQSSGPVSITGEQIRILQKTKARYVRITVINDSAIPEGLPGAGNVPWTFLDELIIN